MTGPFRPAVVALRCTGCGSPLRHEDGVRAWTCPACRRAYEPERAPGAVRLAARPYGLLRIGDGGPGFALPFWRLGFTARVHGGTAALRAALAAVTEPGRAFVRAFPLRGAFNVGDPGRALTRARFDERYEDDARLPGTCRITVSSAEAMHLARLFLLADADVAADVSGGTLDLSFDSVTLVAVPWRDEGGSLVCPITGSSFPRANFAC